MRSRLVLVTATLLLACLGGVAAAGPSTAAPRAGSHTTTDGRTGTGPIAAQCAQPYDVLQYGYDDQRDGDNTCETTLTAANAGQLALQWKFQLGGPSITEPMVVNGVNVNGTPTDLVLVGDSLGHVFAVDRETGQQVWSVDLGYTPNLIKGEPCNINGVQGAFAVDPVNNIVYVADQGDVYALSLSTGATMPGWPVQITSDPVHEVEWGALHLYNGYVYAAIGATCPDVPNYTGRVIEIATGTDGTATPPQITSVWCATQPCISGGTTGEGGGIWGYGGESIDPVTNQMFTATGNAIIGHSNSQYAEHVVQLSLPGLGFVAADDTGTRTGGDRDFGSTPMVFAPPGCPTEVAVLNKFGTLSLYDEGSFNTGPVQMLQVANNNSDKLIGVAAYSAATNMVYVSDSSDAPQPSPFLHGMLALAVQPDCTLGFAWDTSVGRNSITVSPPTLAGGVVYFGNGTGLTEYAMNAATGALLWSVTEPIGERLFAAPTVADGSLLFVTCGRKPPLNWLYSFRVPGT